MPLHCGPRHAPAQAPDPCFGADRPPAQESRRAVRAGDGAWMPRALPTDTNEPAFSWVDQDFEEPFFD